MHFPAVRMTHRRARRDAFPQFSNINRRQFGLGGQSPPPPTFAVVPNDPIRPTPVRPTVTQTVIVPPTATPNAPARPVLTGVRPELSGKATQTPNPIAGAGTVGQPPPSNATPAAGQGGANPAGPNATLQPISSSVASLPASNPAPVPSTTSIPVTVATNTPIRNIASTTLSTSSASSVPSDASNAGATSKGISPTAIGVVAGVVALAVVCAIAFFVRRRFLRRRSERRNTWGASYMNDRRDAFTTTAPQFEKPAQSQSYNATYEPSFQSSNNLRDENLLQNPYDRYPTKPTNNFSSGGGPAPPPSSYNNPQNSYMSPASSVSQPLPYTPNLGSTSVGAATTDPNSVTVLRVFIPSLPDELHISAGERVRIVTAYDDGWALCANSRGEQGVVPLECLDRPQGNAAPQGGDWRNMKRASSLYSASGASAQRY